MITKKTIELGDYTVTVSYDDSGNEHLVVTILDSLGEVIDGIEVYNSDEEE